MKNNYKEVWDKNHRAFLKNNPQLTGLYDGWLDDFSEIWQNAKFPIIDLGCGVTGNNTSFLLKNNKEVISCDFSEIAINAVQKAFPEAKTKIFDLANGLPFKDQSADLILADLCLHYFSEATTKMIISELKRVLIPGGHLLFRVNSTKTQEYKNLSSNKEPEIEKNFFYSKQMTKRFFSENDIKTFFKDWKILLIKEEPMDRYNTDKNQHNVNKIVWKCGMQKEN